MNNGAAVIRTYDLSKRFGDLVAVDCVNFDVQQGEVFGFLGPNGAGKTTTIAMLLGLVRPTSGSAEVLGQDIRHNLAPALLRVGAIVETPSFYPYLSGEDNLRIFARIVGNQVERNIPAVLDRVGLEKRGRDKVGTYSLGMRQRLGLACALVGDPELLILDEPTNGLDPAGMQEIRSFIRHLAAVEGKAVFLSSHLLHEVEQVCDRVLILNRGQVIAQGRVDEMLSQTHGVELRIANPSQAAAILSDLDWVNEARAEGEWVLVRASPERAPDLVAALAAHNCFPYEVRPVVATLESVFLGLTESDNDEPAA